MILCLNDLSYRYSPRQERVLNSLTLLIDTSRITGLAGANGSGKTTLIRILLGQLVSFEGEYLIDDTSGSLPFTYSFCYSPETPILDNALTGYEILSLVADIRSVDKKSFNE